MRYPKEVKGTWQVSRTDAFYMHARTRVRIGIRFTHHDQKMNMGQTHPLLHRRIVEHAIKLARVIMTVWNQ